MVPLKLVNLDRYYSINQIMHQNISVQNRDILLLNAA